MKISKEKVEFVLDTIYKNSNKSNQKSFTEIAKQAELCYPTVRKIISVLQSMSLLTVTGEKAATSYHWNPEKSAVNSLMVQKVIELYDDAPSVTSITSTKLTVEKAVNFLQSKGWTGTLTKSYKDSLITYTETINLE